MNWLSFYPLRLRSGKPSYARREPSFEGHTSPRAEGGGQPLRRKDDGLPYEAPSLRRGEVWAGLDSNQRRREPADLQSAPFGRFGTYPNKVFPPPCKRAGNCRPPGLRESQLLSPAAGPSQVLFPRGARGVVGSASDGTVDNNRNKNREFSRYFASCFGFRIYCSLPNPLRGLPENSATRPAEFVISRIVQYGGRGSSVSEG